MTQLQTITNRIFHNDDSVYIGNILDIDTYELKQSKGATTSINKPNGKIFSVI